MTATATRARAELSAALGSSLADSERQGTPVPRPAGSASAQEQGHASSITGRRICVGVALALLAWSLWGSGIGRRAIVNPRGWSQFARFWKAAAHPELSGDFLRLTWHASLRTLCYAIVGTLLSVAIGLVGGVLTSQTWWARERRPTASRVAWMGSRLLGALGRGPHEAVWGLFLLAFLGRNPLVAVLAIAIPFGAITAKVYAELIDDTAAGPYRALRMNGAGRLSALMYAVAPITAGDLLSYAFYRLECSIRSAVVLGLIGAGGLGFQLSLSFSGLRYSEMWTLIYAVVLLSALAEWWGASLRRRGSRRRSKLSACAVLCAGVLAAYQLRLNPATLVAPRARRLLRRLAAEAWPPRLPAGGWSALRQAVFDTVQLSVLAIVLAACFAVPISFFAARGGVRSRRVRSALVRAVLQLSRAVPAPVGALIVLFLLFPGPLPGAVALGLYTAGVLGRLMGEAVENVNPRPYDALRSGGARRSAAFAYTTLPHLVPRFTSFTLYRWEVTLRETVIVGLVGAGGLGRILAQQNAAFDYPGMLGTVATLVVLSMVVDFLSAAARRQLR